MRAARETVGQNVQAGELVAQAQRQAEALWLNYGPALGWQISVRWPEPAPAVEDPRRARG